MSPRKSVRSVFVAVSAAVALSVGPALLSAPSALAAPGEFPLDGQGGSENNPENNSPKNNSPEDSSPEDSSPLDEMAERAENAGGGLATEVIDLNADTLKCALSIFTTTVDCPLGD
ncbi:hypothetical protein [Nocardia jinanensis]|uniref:DUF732 domain-containing protein n=1 Tax=Nocardia jinanensis TaxID=382504 RepID=A0A917VS55_9NOCA|nr:hypothetical protein [Nocardia jinanensis]GGL08916.1 hypothetical protein GCM10011588_24070 [Nocardia jinanensis]